MFSRIPKTGIASRMREWMSKQRKPFTTAQIADGLGALPGKEKEKICNALADFITRAEVVPLGKYVLRRKPTVLVNRYAYNPAWHRVHKGTLNKRIYKAMYVSGTFAISDIHRLSEAPERSWVDKIAKALRKKGLIQVVGRRPCTHGIGAEILYYIPDRDRFRLEVMG